MASLLYQTIDALSREKGIDPQIVVSAVEDAIVVATRKYYKSQENLRAELDKESGSIKAFAVKTVVETPEQVEDPNLQITLEDAKKVDASVEVGGEVRFYKATDVLGRIAAQLAKQVIFQKVREAERDTVYNEYIGRVGEVVNATVKRIEGPDVIFEMGKTEARMPRKEQSRLESFAMGERVRVVIGRVEKASKGPQVVVSRAAPELVQHLFQTEVPEIYDGTVVIRAIAREAGERTKIAVMSKDKDVDCGGRLRGHEGHARAVHHPRTARGEDRHHRVARRPGNLRREGVAAGQRSSRCRCWTSGEKHLEVIVDDSQLSLAIGKKGQNVRLAAKLLGWKIDIKSEEEKRQEVEQQMQALVGSANTPLDRVEGLGEGLIEKLIEAGVTTVEALADMTPEQLEAIPGIGPKTVEKISIAVNNYFSSLEAGELTAEEAAEVAAEEPAAAEETAPEAGSPEAEEAAATGQAVESATLVGVENAPAAEVAEVPTQGDELPEGKAPASQETPQPEEPPAEDAATEK